MSNLADLVKPPEHYMEKYRGAREIRIKEAIATINNMIEKSEGASNLIKANISLKNIDEAFELSKLYISKGWYVREYNALRFVISSEAPIPPVRFD